MNGIRGTQQQFSVWIKVSNENVPLQQVRVRIPNLELRCKNDSIGLLDLTPPKSSNSDSQFTYESDSDSTQNSPHLRLRHRLLNSGYQTRNKEDTFVRVVCKVQVFQCLHETSLSKCDREQGVELTFVQRTFLCI